MFAHNGSRKGQEYGVCSKRDYESPGAVIAGAKSDVERFYAIVALTRRLVGSVNRSFSSVSPRCRTDACQHSFMIVSLLFNIHLTAAQ